MKYPPYLWLVGMAAGFVNGFLGAGGGIVLVFAIAAFYDADKNGRVRDVFATSVASILPISAVSVASYAVNAHSDFSLATRFILPALIGGALGAYITDKINGEALKTVFAVVTVIAGINMIFK